MTDQLEFARSIEGQFIKGLGPALTTEVKAKLRAAGLDLDGKILPAYPAADVHRWIGVAAKAVYPSDVMEEGARKMAHLMIAGLEDSLIGRALTAGLKLLGPRRSLDRVHRVFRNNGNYQEVTILEIGNDSARVRVEYVFGLPTYYQGLFEGVLRLIDAKNPTVKITGTPGPGTILQVNWQP